MTTSGWIPNVFVILTALIQAALVAILARRNKRAEFPVFFCYNAIAVAGAALLFFADTAKVSVSQYFWLYWSVNALLMFVEFGVMYEVFVKALQPYTGLIDLGKMLFRWAGVFLFVVAALTALATTDSSLGKCIVAMNLLHRGLRLMQCGLLLLFFLFERRLGLAWRSYSISIGLGLGTTAALELSISYLHSRFTTWAFALDFVNLAQYLFVVSFWAFCFYVREPERSNVLDSPSKLIFQRWNDVLITTRFSPAPSSGSTLGSIESFLPNVEQTVDRVMARKMVQ